MAIKILQDDPTKPLMGPVALIVTMLVAAAGVAGFTFGIFPGLSRGVAPIVCPAKTASSQIVLDVHQSGSKTTTTPHLVCTHESGRMVRVGPGTLFLTQAGLYWGLFVGLVLLGRWRRGSR